MKLRITSTALNAGDLAAACIDSVRKQTYTNWTYDYFDAASDDDTAALSAHAIGDDTRVQLHVETARTGLFDKLVPCWRSFDDDDVIVWIDGDDQLATRSALQTVADVHARGAQLTYGQFIWSDGTLGFAAPVGPDPRYESWRSTHLKTFRAGLFKRIHDEHLRTTNGEYCRLALDLAVMWPMLEMAPSQSVFVPKVLYIYNQQHSHIANNPHDLVLEQAECYRLRSLPRYEPLAP